MPDRDENPRRQFTDQELLQAVSAHAPASTREVADAVGATRRAVDYRLKDLADHGEVQRKRVAKVQIWYTDCQ